MTPKWITDRNPGIEELEDYSGTHTKEFYVTTDSGDVCVRAFIMDPAAPDGTWVDAYYDDLDFEVVAWMPIPKPEFPEPYRPERSK